MKISKLLQIAGLAGSLTIAGLGTGCSKSANDIDTRARLSFYYTKDGKDYALLESPYKFGDQNLPGSFVGTERYSIPSNNCPNLKAGDIVNP